MRGSKPGKAGWGQVGLDTHHYHAARLRPRGRGFLTLFRPSQHTHTKALELPGHLLTIQSHSRDPGESASVGLGCGQKSISNKLQQ